MKSGSFSKFFKFFCLFVFVLSLSCAAKADEEKGYWKFSHILKEDKEQGSPASNNLFERKGYVTNDNFTDNGAGSLVVNFEIKSLKDGKKSIFRGKLSSTGLPLILKPGQTYKTVLKAEEIEFILLGKMNLVDAIIALSHTRAREPITTLEKVPFFRLGELDLPGVAGSANRKAQKEFSFKAAAHSKGKDEYGIKLLMMTSKVHATRVFVYRWHTDEENNDFHCPHCGKAIDKNLLPR
jgi:hypothetical protein